jgi:hydrogenase maturation protease
MTFNTAVLGMGNLLLGDEGAGVHLARLLQHREDLIGVKVLDIGTAILDALPALEECDRVIVLDAIRAGGTAGTIYRMPLSEFKEKECIASLHGFDLQSVLRLTQRRSQPEIIVIGVEPGIMDWSLDLSPEVEAALPALASLVVETVAQAPPKAKKCYPWAMAMGD